jgi:hypothetical protein
VLDRVSHSLEEAGYQVERCQLFLSRGDQRFFGTLDLSTSLAIGVNLVVGVRNSIDKSFPSAFCAGSRVLVSDAVAFTSELLVKSKHTLNGEQRFAKAVAEAVARLSDFRLEEAARIRKLQHMELADAWADSLILRAFEKDIVSTQLLPHIIREWRRPKFDEFRERTAWSLWNAFTSVLAKRMFKDPYKFAVQTMHLNHHLLDWKGGEAPGTEPVA